VNHAIQAAPSRIDSAAHLNHVLRRERNGQDDSNDCAFHPNQEARVESLPPALAASKSESAVLAASVAIAIMEPDVCCGRNSVLEDQVASATGLSLRQVGEKLRGKHYSGDGLPIVVADQYWSGASVTAEEIIATFRHSAHC